MFITNDVKYAGVKDDKIDLFEGQYVVPEGIAYNSYVITDEKTAVLDTADKNFYEEWLKNVKTALDGRTPDYLIVSHMEPDHSANIAKFAAEYKNVKIVGNAKTFTFLKNFFGEDYAARRVVVADGEELSLGKHLLTFVFAPFVHWPEVMMTYDKTDKILFSADGFGRFGNPDESEEWDCEARRYYFGIVGKYGAQVQAVLKKAAALDVKIICPLHGPVLTKNLSHYLDLYNIWSSYSAESKGVLVAYTSVYGHTAKAAEILANKITEKGVKAVLCDLARSDMAEAVEDAFRYDRLVLATTTYNGDIFPYMKEFINHLTERNYKNRTVGFIENGSWAPVATKVMKGMLEKSQNLTYTETNVKILSALTSENEAELTALADELTK